MYTHVWQNFVHLLVVRHPFERAISAFNFGIPRIYRASNSVRPSFGVPPLAAAQFSHIQVCRKRNVTRLLKCFEHCLQLCMGGRSSRRYDWFAKLAPATANMVGSQICGNFLTQHLSHNSTLRVASTNLRRFTLIVDLTSHPTLSSELLSCVLGWDHPNVPRTNRNAASHSGLLQLSDLSTKHLQIMHRLMHDDVMLYNEAIRLMVQHHSRAMVKMYGRK